MSERTDKKTPAPAGSYTLGEEIANSVSHGVGTMLAVAELTIVVVFAALSRDPWRIVSCSIYGVTLVCGFLSSTLYHSFPQPSVKRIFKVLDHASIYLLIAGTYTPLLLVNMRGPWGWSLFGVIWGLAIAGVLFKAFFISRLRILSTIIYVLMGWGCVVALKPLIAAVPLGGMLWLLGGGLLYTSGVAFYLWKKLPYGHAIWHIFVLAGSICHFFAILFYAV